MNRAAQMEKVACDVFSQVRTSIVLKMRFLDLAVFKLKPTPSQLRLATDGIYLYYLPSWVLKKYHEEPNAVVRDYMHVMLHCIFRHPFVSSSLSKEIWDLSCDIAVEAIISNLKQPIMETRDDVKKNATICWLQSRINLLTAEKIYKYLLQNPPNPEWFDLFKSDDHDIWHNHAMQIAMRIAASQKENSNKEEKKQESSRGSTSQNDRKEKNEHSQSNGSNNSNQSKSKRSSDSSTGNSDDTSDDEKQRNDKSESNSSQHAENGSEENSNTDDASDDEKQRGDKSESNSSQHAENGSEENSNTAQSNNDDKSHSDSSPEEENDGNDDNTTSKTSEKAAGSSNSASSNDGVETEGSSNSSENNDSEIEDNSFGDQPGNSSQQYDPSMVSKNVKHRLSEKKADKGNLQFEYSPSSDQNSEWKDISERIQMDLESFAKNQGYQAGNLGQMLGIINREKYDYETFLRKFAVLGEEMKINDDEFDYIFYTYGLKLFGNMPLIEPLEYKEVKKIREFVIAIDTSGSTSGELVNAFLTKTYNILLSTDSFFSKVNIYIVQCDAVIQECVHIRKKEDFEKYIAQMSIKGGGGTDFRPVFNYVDKLVESKQFAHLKGMIYFTDGMGTYPKQKPKYQTAFVFIQDTYHDINVPPWAMKLVLEKEKL